MVIVARVNREDFNLFSTLKARGITCKIVRGATIIELAKARESTYDKTVYDIPVEAKDATLFIDVAEEGGGMTNSGYSTIVCGMSGKMLKPYHVPKGCSNAEHAFFSVPGSVVTIKGYRPAENICIEQHNIVRTGAKAEIETTDLWRGKVDDLPGIFNHYQEAAEAAYAKAKCYHCRHVHYAAVR